MRKTLKMIVICLTILLVIIVGFCIIKTFRAYTIISNIKKVGNEIFNDTTRNYHLTILNEDETAKTEVYYNNGIKRIETYFGEELVTVTWKNFETGESIAKIGDSEVAYSDDIDTTMKPRYFMEENQKMSLLDYFKATIKSDGNTYVLYFKPNYKCYYDKGTSTLVKFEDIITGTDTPITTSICKIEFDTVSVSDVEKP